MSDRVKCEACSINDADADADMCVWNGKDYVRVCVDCYHDIESIATEACVRFAERWDNASLEECTRIELGFRDDVPWTPELQAEVDKRYCEWYLEWREEVK